VFHQETQYLSPAFVASAGRCGTQWLASAFNTYYSDLVDARHEPLTFKYSPRTLIRSPLPFEEHPNYPIIDSHLRRIADILVSRIYLETGWPVIGALRLMYDRFGSRIRIVHLTRHPVYSACSMVTHRYYLSNRNDGYTAYAILQPTDSSVIHSEFIERWSGMSAFERCLFHWTEINAYILDLREHLAGDVHWFQTRMEDLFDPQKEALAELVEFLGLPSRAKFLSLRDKRVDQFATVTRQPLNLTDINKYPEVVELASLLGYNVDDVDEDGIKARYHQHLFGTD
jgi:hypothetical protein